MMLLKLAMHLLTLCSVPLISAQETSKLAYLGLGFYGRLEVVEH